MRGTPHALLGVSCGLIVAGAHFSAHPELVGLGVLGALLPDIDHARSTIGRYFRPISWLVTRFVEHRGPTHSILVATICALPVAYWLGEAAGWALWLGYISHLLADMTTMFGLPLLWPCKYMFRLKLFRSGSFVEWPISLVILFFTVVWLENIPLL